MQEIYTLNQENSKLRENGVSFSWGKADLMSRMRTSLLFLGMLSALCFILLAVFLFVVTFVSVSGISASFELTLLQSSILVGIVALLLLIATLLLIHSSIMSALKFKEEKNEGLTTASREDEPHEVAPSVAELFEHAKILVAEGISRGREALKIATAPTRWYQEKPLIFLTGTVILSALASYRFFSADRRFQPRRRPPLGSPNERPIQKKEPAEKRSISSALLMTAIVYTLKFCSEQIVAQLLGHWNWGKEQSELATSTTHQPLKGQRRRTYEKLVRHNSIPAGTLTSSSAG